MAHAAGVSEVANTDQALVRHLLEREASPSTLQIFPSYYNVLQPAIENFFYIGLPRNQLLRARPRTH